MAQYASVHFQELSPWKSQLRVDKCASTHQVDHDPHIHVYFYVFESIYDHLRMIASAMEVHHHQVHFLLLKSLPAWHAACRPDAHVLLARASYLVQAE